MLLADASDRLRYCDCADSTACKARVIDFFYAIEELDRFQVLAVVKGLALHLPDSARNCDIYNPAIVKAILRDLL